MMVNNPLEIYTTVIGVGMYDQVFNVLLGVGIAYFPLIGIFFNALRQALSGDIKDTVPMAFGHAVVSLVIYIFVMMVFVVPTHSIDISEVSYKNNCSTGSVDSSYGNTGTTYDDVFGDITFDEYKLPPGIFAVLGYASGITNSLIVTLPCKTDIEKAKTTINDTSLSSELMSEIHQFKKDCYNVAKGMFNSQKPDESEYESIMDKSGGESDLSWMGSYVYQSLYYSSMYPSTPVKSFSYSAYPDPYADTNDDSGVNNPDDGGYPSCLAWWSDGTYGIESRIVSTVNSQKPNNSHLSQKSVSQEVGDWMIENPSYVGSQLTQNDLVTHAILDRTKSYNSSVTNNFGIAPTTGMGNFSDDVGSAAQWVKQFSSNVGNAETEHQVPITQAILIAITLMLGPFVLLLGGLRVPVVFSYSFFLGSLYMMTFIEKFLHYIDLSLHDSAGKADFGMGYANYLHNSFSNFYEYGPFIVLMLMGAFGVWTGGEAGKMMNQGGGTGSGAGLMGKAAGMVSSVLL